MKKALVALGGTAAIVAVGGFLLVSAPGPTPSGIAPGPSSGNGEATTVATSFPGASPGSAAHEAAGEKDFQALAAAALKIRDPERRDAALAAVLTDWLRVDPAGFGRYLMRLEVERDMAKLNLLANALQATLEAMDPAVAASVTVREPVRRFILHLARQDPDRALEWANTWLVDDGRDATLVAISRALATRSPAEGLALATRIGSPLRRMQALAFVGGIWARSDPAAAVAWASGLQVPTEQAMALNAVLIEIAQRDPESAAARLTTAERAMTEAYAAKFLADLAAMNLTEADLANDPDTYMEMLEAGEVPPRTSPDIELLAEAARLVASKLAAESPLAGRDWAESIENPFVRLNAVKGAIDGWSQVDPEAAASYVAASWARYPEMMTTVYDAWADSAPERAAAGTRMLGDPRLRAAATAAVAERWAESNPAAAAAWVDGLPATERTDAVQLALVSAMSPVNAVAAWNRAQAIQDPSMRYRGLKAAFAELVIRQPEVARDLLAAATTLSERHAERLHALLEATEQG